MNPSERLAVQALRAQLVAQIMTIDALLNLEPQDEMPPAFVTMGQEVEDDGPEISIRSADSYSGH